MTDYSAARQGCDKFVRLSNRPVEVSSRRTARTESAIIGGNDGAVYLRSPFRIVRLLPSRPATMPDAASNIPLGSGTTFPCKRKRASIPLNDTYVPPLPISPY